MTTYYKVLNEDGSCCHGGTGNWHLPKDGKPGKWMPSIKGELIPCVRGYHVLEARDLTQWLGPAIYKVQIGKQYIRDSAKGVTERARLVEKLLAWDEDTARLFAADCAEHVLHFYEAKYPNDDRPRKAIVAARDYAEGRIGAAAGAAAGDAAWGAARAAARAAAGDAARAAAGAAEQRWQSDLLLTILGE